MTSDPATLRQATALLADAAALRVVAGFDGTPLAECHGSIRLLPCTRSCCDAIWPADDIVPVVVELDAVRAACGR